MKPIVKIGLVAAGYVAAFGVAAVGVVFQSMFMNNSATHASSGMSAFGDVLFSGAVFGLAAVIPTAAALFFLRPVPGFWRLFTGLVIVGALSGLAALAGSVAAPFSAIAPFALMRILAAPFCTLYLLVSSVIAPNRVARIIALAGATLEVSVFMLWLLLFFFKAH
jgi:hypothetical protein